MKNRYSVILTATALTFLLAGQVHADSANDKAPMEGMNHGMDHGKAKAHGKMMQNDMPLSSGTVRKVDMEKRKLTIKHGPIQNLGMPPMTMVFGVDEAVDMDDLAAGEEVEFEAMERDGKMIVTRVQRGK